MNKPLSEKEILLTRLTEIYDQLEELDSVLEASFSDYRINLSREVHEKIAIPVQRLSDIGKKIANVAPFSSNDIPNSNLGHGTKSLKLELGF